MVFSYRLGSSSASAYTSLIILSYPNSTDFDLVISDNLKEYNNVCINLNNKLAIKNKLFGYNVYGIKIVDFYDGLNIKSYNTGKKIKKKDILVDEENVVLVLSKEGNIPKNAKIVFAMIVTEHDYDYLDNYTYRINNTYCSDNCDKERYYFKKII